MLISLPPLFGWSAYSYDEKMMLCAWDDDKDRSYNIFIVVCGVLLQMFLVTYFYVLLFLNVRTTHRQVSSQMNGCSRQIYNSKKSTENANLLKMLVVTTCCLYICWLPYGLQCLMFDKDINANHKKILGWLGLSNSSANFMIYGMMNPFFRKGYYELLCRKIPNALRTQSVATHSSVRRSRSGRDVVWLRSLGYKVKKIHYSISDEGEKMEKDDATAQV